MMLAAYRRHGYRDLSLTYRRRTEEVFILRRESSELGGLWGGLC
jgi:hypothetical protein